MSTEALTPPAAVDDLDLKRLGELLVGAVCAAALLRHKLPRYTRPGGKKIRRTVAMGEASFHVRWQKCLEAADVRYRRPHMARHTFATRYLRKGGRLETLSMVMGHESIRTTYDLYAHLDMRDAALDMALIEI